jgi:transcriptional regulator NrdR family protein
MPTPADRESQLPLDVTWSRPSPLVDRRQADRRQGGRRWTDAEARMRLECPHCGDMYSLAVPHHQTAAEQLTDAFWRIRRCAGCHRTYSTSERVEASPKE